MEKAWLQLHKNAVSPEGDTPQNSCCTATYHLSRKQSKLDEPDMQGIAREVRTSS